MGENEIERYPGKRNGMPQQVIYTSPAFHESLQPVMDRLKSEQSEVLQHFPTVRELAKLLYDVLGFLESAYGRHALTKPFPKLPYSLFRDTRSNGAIDILVRAVADHVKKVTIPVHNRKKIDWTSPALRKELQELLSHVRTELVRAGCIRQFKVYFDGIKNIENLQEMKQAVVKLGGQVASNPKETGVTHIIVPNSKEMKDGRETRRTGKDDPEEYFWRTVAKHDTLGYALVHWWYLPDSYNEFVPYESAPVDLDADEAPPSGRPWVVHERWVVDSETYNEWMNEGDYETEASADENKRLREAKGMGGDGQVAASEPQRKKTKKELRVEEAAAEVGVAIRRVLAPGVVEREVKIVDRRAIEAVHVPTIDLSHGYRQQWMGSYQDQNRVGSGGVKGKEGVEGDKRRHAIPFAAGWFNKTTIHHIELREFLEFQKEYQGPGWTDYRTMRNHIVDAFAKNPRRRLAFRDIANDLNADSMLVLKIYKFLDRWGIINRFDMEGTGYDPGNLERATRAGLASILSVSKKPFELSKAVELWTAGGRHSKTRLRPGTMQQYSVVPTGYTLPDGSKAPFCASRPWIRCDGKHYANSSDSRFVLCVDAYKNGEFPPGTSARDFVLRDGIPARLDGARHTGTGAAASSSRKPFSPQEDLLLLEAINKNWKKVEAVGSNGQPHVRPIYDWAAISAAVIGRSEAECVQRYLEYPIEESLLMAALDFDEGFPLLTLGDDGTTSIPERYRRAPYNSKDMFKTKADINPLVGNLATILYVIGPEVASDAARHALESVIEQADAAEANGASGGDNEVAQMINAKDAGEVKDEPGQTNVKTEDVEQKQEAPGSNPMRHGVHIDILRKASFEAVSKAAIRAQELAHERMMSMYSIIMRMCDVQLERIWEKCDYLETLVGNGGDGEDLHGQLQLAASKTAK